MLYLQLVVTTNNYVSNIISKDLCDGATLYADLIHQKLISEGYYDDEGQFDVTEPVRIL